jgi:predicted glycosyltransferase
MIPDLAACHDLLDAIRTTLLVPHPRGKGLPAHTQLLSDRALTVLGTIDHLRGEGLTAERMTDAARVLRKAGGA